MIANFGSRPGKPDSDRIELRALLRQDIAVLDNSPRAEPRRDTLARQERPGGDVFIDRVARTAGLEEGADGRLVMAQPPTDPRYGQPLSGLYWQVDTADGPLTSRSLWDSVIALAPDDPRDGRPHEHLVPGPDGATLLVLERTVFAPRFGRDGVRLIVALAIGGQLFGIVGLLLAVPVAAMLKVAGIAAIDGYRATDFYARGAASTEG